jgi:ribosome recycling factor
MNEELDMCFEEATSQMDKAIEHLKKEFTKIRAGKASPFMLDSVQVDYYGSMTPLSQVANIATPDARTLSVQPWEKNMLDPITKAITIANLGFNPQNNGESIIISIPPLTEERRKELAKTAKAEVENCKIGLRNARKNAMDYIKQLVKDGLPEDAGKDAENKVQDLVNKYSKNSEDLFNTKEKEIMTV